MSLTKIDLLLPFALILIAEALFFLGHPMDGLLSMV